MLSNGIEKNPLFEEINSLLEAMNLKAVDCIKNDTPQGVQMIITVYSPEREITTDDLAAVYNIIYPRYQVIFGDRDLMLEVSSPGLQRSLRDTYEFSLFTSRLVKVYTTKYSSWVEGYIEHSDEKSVTLRDAVIIDTGSEEKEITLPFTEVQKAKLSFRWEEK